MISHACERYWPWACQARCSVSQPCDAIGGRINAQQTAGEVSQSFDVGSGGGYCRRDFLRVHLLTYMLVPGQVPAKQMPPRHSLPNCAMSSHSPKPPSPPQARATATTEPGSRSACSVTLRRRRGRCPRRPSATTSLTSSVSLQERYKTTHVPSMRRLHRRRPSRSR